MEEQLIEWVESRRVTEDDREDNWYNMQMSEVDDS